MPARDLDKARNALAGIGQVEIEGMDLIDPESVEAFADRFLHLEGASISWSIVPASWRFLN